METINYRGVEIEIRPDEMSESPNEWWDNERFLVYDHRDFYVEKKGFNPRDIFDYFEEHAFKKVLYQGYFVFTVYAYIHSGVALSLGRSRYPFNDRWDVSSTGNILIKRQKGVWTEAKARKIAEGLIETWNQYLSGDVWGYNIEQFNDSCWGYYGYDTCLEEAKRIVDWHLEENRKKRIATLKQLIKSKVPLEYRQKQLLTLSSTYN